MQKIRVDWLKPGMRLAQDVQTARGDILLYAGTELSQIYINKMISLGIASVLVHLPKEETKEVNHSLGKKISSDGVSEEVRYQAQELVDDILKDIKETGQLSDSHVVQTKGTVGKIIEDIMENRVIVEKIEDYEPLNSVVDQLITQKEIFSNLETIKDYDEYTFVHCVNVCIMSVIMGWALDYSKEELMELGVGALLHDVGKVKVRKDVLNKPGKLSDEERLEMERHTSYTFEILKLRDDISQYAALIAYQHHERFDGQGYPQGLKGSYIHLYSRIVAIADVYDALVTDRIYRPRLHSYEAAEIIQASSGTHFDPALVKVFIDNIVIYPVGSPIELNNGCRGVVARINKSMPARPVVIIFYDEHGNNLGNPLEIDLTKNLTLFISKVYTNNIV